MILRRFMKHVADQNWFAVGLDVVVVVVGIFLGMQVTEWNDDRKEQQNERLFLTQLEADIQFVLSEIERAQSEHDIMAKHGKLAIRLLQGENLLGDHQEDIEAAFQEMHQVPAPQINFGNLKIVLEGRSNSKFNSPEISKKLADLSNELGPLVEIYEIIEKKLDATTRYFRSQVSYAVPSDSDFPIRYDLQQMRASAVFKHDLQNAVTFQTYASRQLAKMSDLLVQFLGKTQ